MAAIYGESSNDGYGKVNNKRSGTPIIADAKAIKVIKVAIPTKKGEIWHEEVLETLRAISSKGKESKPLVLAENISEKRFKELCILSPDIFSEFKTHWDNKLIYVAAEPSEGHEIAIDFFVSRFHIQGGQNVFSNGGSSHVYDANGFSVGADGSIKLKNQPPAANNNSNGRGTPYPVIFIEIHISRTLQHLHTLCSRLAALPHVNGVIGIKCLSKTVRNNFQAVYYYYSSANPAVPAIATSFGTLALTNDNMNKIYRVTGIAVANINGYVAGGPAAGQVTAAQPHTINIPWNSIYAGTNVVAPAGNYTFNLFDLQQDLQNSHFGSLA